MSEGHFHLVYEYCLSLLDNFPLEKILLYAHCLITSFFFSFGTQTALPGLDWALEGAGIPADKGSLGCNNNFFWDIPFSAMANPVDGAARRLSTIGSPSLFTRLIQFALVIGVIAYD